MFCLIGVANIDVFSYPTKFFNYFYKDFREMEKYRNINRTYPVTLWALFFVFAKIGAFTLGGGYAMIAVIENEIVKKRRWLLEDEFLNILTIAQSTPGLLAVNISIFVGYKLFKNKGSVVATIGTCLPPFIIILLIATIFSTFKENIYVEKIFKGIRPVVVALIAVPVISMIRHSNLNLYKILLLISTAVAIIFLKISPIYIILVLLISFFTIRYYQDRKEKKNCSAEKDDIIESGNI